MRMTSTRGLKRVDLGRLNPACPARWHGTNPAYAAGCRCPHAVDAHRVYNKRCREGRLTPSLLDSTGTRRRVQGMWALGHTSAVIAEHCAERIFPSQVTRFCAQPLITPKHRDLIVGAYAQLSTRGGSSSITRRRAASAGFNLPIQWGADIDDPSAQPEPLESEAFEPEPDTGVLDEYAIDMALSGRAVPLTDDELVAAVQIGTARGLGPVTMAPLLGIDWRVVSRLAAGDVPPRLASITRRRLANLGLAA